MAANGAPVQIEFSLDAGADAPARARQGIAQLAPHLPTRSYEELRTVVTELVGNAVRHGPGRTIHVRAGLDGRGVFGEVEDQGEGDVAVRSADPDETGGFGLRIVGRLCDDWGVYEGSTHVWFRLATP
jgi:anti-sigma regulatory factor (Ser/Thr protein kinase)